MTGKQKKRAVVLVAVLAIIGAGAGAYVLRETMRERAAMTGREEGLAALARGDYPEALAGLSRYIARHPKDAIALLSFAQARLEVPMANSRHLDQAAALARLARDNGYTGPAALEILLEVQGRRGYMSELLLTADALLAMDASHNDALQARVLALASVGRDRDALDGALRRAEVYPDDVLAHTQVLFLMQRLDLPDAELTAYADNLVSRDPARADFAVLQCRTHDLVGDRDGAVLAAQNASDLPMGDGATIADVLQVLDRLRMTEEADAFVQRMLASPGIRREATLILAQRAWKLGDEETARATVAGLIGVPADAADDELGWGAYIRPNGMAGDDAILTELIGRDSEAAREWSGVLQARRAVAAGDPAAALRQLANVAAENEAGRFVLGEAYALLGDWRAAYRAWSDLTDSDPSCVVARLRGARVLLDHGSYQEAAREAERALAVRPTFVGAFTYVAASVAILEAGRTGVADVPGIRLVLNALIERNPSAGDVRCLLVRFHAANGDTDQAASETEALLTLAEPCPPEHLVSLVGPLRRLDSALSDRVLLHASAAPQDPELGLLIASVEAASGRPDDARKRLSGLAAVVQPAERLSWDLRVADLLDRIGDESAVQRFIDLAESNPRSAAAQLALLESQSAWSNEQAILGAIARLRAELGEASTVYMTYEARCLLTFNPTERSAADALKLLAVASQVAPGGATELSLQSAAWLRLGDRARAIDSLAEAASAEPNRATLYPQLVALLQQSGQLGEAEDRLLAFLRLGDLPAPFRRVRVELLASQGMWEEAAADLAPLAALGGQEDVLALAQIRVRQQKHPEAEALFARLLAEDVPEWRAVVAAADFFASQGDLDRGLCTLERLPDSMPAEAPAVTTALFLERHGSTDQAESRLAEASKMGNIDATVEYARMLITAGRTQDAIAEIDRAMPTEPDARLARLRALASISTQEGSRANALSELGAMLAAHDAPEPAPRFIKALEDFEREPTKSSELLAVLEEITREFPRFYPAWEKVVQLLQQTGQADRAAAVAQTAAGLSRTDPRPAHLAAEALAAVGRLDDARIAALEWRARAAIDPFEADCALAQLEAAQGSAGAALVRLTRYRDRIIAAADRQPSALELLARISAQAEAAEDAHTLIWERAGADRRWAMAYLRVSEAVPSRERALWIERVSPLLADQSKGRLLLAEAWFALAEGPLENGNLGRALDLALGIPAEDELAGPALLLAGICYERLGQNVEAEHMYRQALAKLPDEPLTLNNLACLLLRRNGDPAESLRLAERAVALMRVAQPGDKALPDYLDTLGMSLVASHRPQDAEATFREAMKLDPMFPAAIIGLAEALANQEQFQEAKGVLGALPYDFSTQDRSLGDRYALLRQTLDRAP
jgi:Tfp pilus assembly protein PilF